MEEVSTKIKLVYEHSELTKEEIISGHLSHSSSEYVALYSREINRKRNRKKFLEFAELSKKFFNYEEVYHRVTIDNFVSPELGIDNVSLDQIIRDTPQDWLPKIDWTSAFLYYKNEYSTLLPTDLASWSKVEKYINFKSICGNTTVYTHWNLDVLKKYKDQLDWKYIQKNKNILWTIELLHFFSSNLNFSGGDFNREYGRRYYQSAVSYLENVNWSSGLILEFVDNWDWNILSQNEFIPWDANLIKQFYKYLNIRSLCINKSVKWNSEMINYCSDLIDWEGLQKNPSVQWNDELIIFYFSKINPWIIIEHNRKSSELDFLKCYRKIQLDFDGFIVNDSGIIDSNGKLFRRKELKGEYSGATRLLEDEYISKTGKNTFTISYHTHTGRVGKDDWYHDTKRTLLIE